MIHRHEIRVRYGETDKMGVVHHSVYALYFEEARTELMRAAGIRYADLEASGYLLPLIDLGMEFKRGPVYDDTVVLDAWLTEVTRVRVRIAYRMSRKGDGELLATGHTHHASTGPDLRPKRLPPEVYDRFRAAVRSEDGGDPERQMDRNQTEV
jgi:acyl-CoA thioester hydrolase